MEEAKHNPAGWFEIPVVDTDRATRFYETLLGITMRRQDNVSGYEMTWFSSGEAEKGANGALMKGLGYVPSAQGTIIYFTCSDIDESLARVEMTGGLVVL